MSVVMENKKSNLIVDWLIRVVKGMFIGIGFITPGLSGGVLAVVFGLYEPLVRFLGNLRHEFVKNFIYFLPVSIGGVGGVIVFSAVVDYAFRNYEAQFIWLFIGFIAGTFPTLFRTSAKEGRKPWHLLLLFIFAVGTFFLLNWLETIRTMQLAQTFLNWVMSGALIGLVFFVPGLSPSNFLIYFGLYQPMAAGISQLNFGVIIPVTIGGLLVVFTFARLFSWLFKNYYTVVYHMIIGIVIGSTIVITPWEVRGRILTISAVLFVFGAVVSYTLAKLEEKYARDEFSTI